MIPDRRSDSGVGPLIAKQAAGRFAARCTAMIGGRQHPLGQMGAEVVVVDGPDLAQRVAEATGGAEIRLGIDAVAGAAVSRLAQCLAEGGTGINYGLMFGEPIQIDAFQFVFRDIHLVGFWLAKVMRPIDFEEIQAMYAKLSE